MKVSSPTETELTMLMAILGHTFTNCEHLKIALTHPSVKANDNVHPKSNERLEFLGDRVLGLVVADMLLERFPEEDEGDISRRHSELVRMESLGEIAQNLNLGRFICVSVGEERMGGRQNPALLADTCEAIIAALYLDDGLDTAAHFVKTHWQSLVEKTPLPPKDAKTMLQEWAQKKGLPVPNYYEIDRDGPAHKPFFTVAVKMLNQGAVEGTGHSKRAAEQKAAEKMLENLSRAKD